MTMRRHPAVLLAAMLFQLCLPATADARQMTPAQRKAAAAEVEAWRRAHPDTRQTLPEPDKDVAPPQSAPSGPCKMPEYPRSSLRNEEQGTVTLDFLIGADGSVIESRIRKSSGFAALDESAREGLSKCHFRPAAIDEKITEAWIGVQYVFSLQ
jgi:protein TonB